ncbi:DUF2141 domain-containing protein [Massilia sp. TWR1-2-2]|uniref:DUF2141 domain-containing protein n=1 Tax=Massilia sp. TWR1-2-2 TaxID=2804584 RepID=UPI003CED9D8A
MTPLGTLSFCTAVLAAAPAGAADLTIHVDDVNAAGGMIHVALYNSADSFMKSVAGIGKTAATGQADTIVLKNLPAGEYAFALFHDANANEKLDKNMFGIPTEDYAFSNNAVGKMGPPSYDSARFTLPAAGATVRVSLR